jgi:hypothetical protein
VERAPTRIVAVGAAAAAAVAIVVTDLTMTNVERWWNRHSLLADVVASVLILAVTILVVDEVTARRRIKERERVAAVQAVIVFGQALRTERILTNDRKGEGEEGDDVASEVRSLALMLLTAAPALFDDPAARLFMERAEGFSATMLRVGMTGQHEITDADRAKLAQAKEELRAAVQPMLVRLGYQEAAILEGDGAT